MSYIVDKLVIADINRSSIPEDVARLFQERINWRDEVFNEHICYIEDIVEHELFDLMSEDSQDVVLKIQEEVSNLGASYIRIVN